MKKYCIEIDDLRIMGWARVAEDVSSAWQQNSILLGYAILRKLAFEERRATLQRDIYVPPSSVNLHNGTSGRIKPAE